MRNNNISNIVWLNKLINKVTRVDESLNNNFEWWGGKYNVTVQSGMRDFAEYTISETNTDNGSQNNILCFSVDYDTLELHFSSYSNEMYRVGVINALIRIYGEVIVSDDVVTELAHDLENQLQEVEKYQKEYDPIYIEQLHDNIRVANEMEGHFTKEIESIPDEYEWGV